MPAGGQTAVLMDPADAFETVVAAQLDVAGVTRRTMFGRDTLLADGHPFAFRDGDHVALRLPEAGELITSGEGTVTMMGRRVMRQWVTVALVGSDELRGRDELRDRDQLRDRLDRARQFENHRGGRSRPPQPRPQDGTA
jgi:hypothetical protein